MVYENARRNFVGASGSKFGSRFHFCANPDTKCISDTKSNRDSVGDSDCDGK
jgi:hypothetical protein